ncbi:MAG TPA: hypothetical protein VGK99_08930 [Acidobacteriota bacterium]|jgi:hypothetical protein
MKFSLLRSWTFLLVLAVLAAVSWAPAPAIPQASRELQTTDSLPAAEFSRLVRDLSEEDGYFRSDNFTSNETSYLHVVDRLHEMRISGGAYIGVGPEQNFTYIAKIRPRIAFIVDIRRQAMLQHLLYKALFHISESRADFLSALLCRPLAGDGAPARDASIERLLEYFGSGPAREEVFSANLVRVRKIIRDDFQLPLSEQDEERLKYVYSAFHKQGLEIAFRIDGANWASDIRRFPTLKDLILQPDLNGKLGNFLAGEDDYRFVRSLHLRNRIIPVVGDFAGPRALASVGGYLRTNGYTVRAFYTSNVEQFLFDNGVFRGFVDNVRKLPIDENSVFIRAVATRGQPHPAYVPGHRTTTILQRIVLFLKDYDEGAYTDYRGLVTKHFIAGQQP